MNTPPNTPISSQEYGLVDQIYSMISSLTGSANTFSKNVQDIETLLDNTSLLNNKSTIRQERFIKVANDLFEKYNVLVSEKSRNSQQVESLKSQLLQLQSDITEKNREKTILEENLNKTSTDKDSQIIELNMKINELYKESDMGLAATKLKELDSLKTLLELTSKKLQDLQVKYHSSLSQLETKTTQFDSSLNSLKDKLGKDSKLNVEINKIQDQAAQLNSSTSGHSPEEEIFYDAFYNQEPESPIKKGGRKSKFGGVITRQLTNKIYLLDSLDLNYISLPEENEIFYLGNIPFSLNTSISRSTTSIDQSNYVYCTSAVLSNKNIDLIEVSLTVYKDSIFLDSFYNRMSNRHNFSNLSHEYDKTVFKHGARKVLCKTLIHLFSNNIIQPKSDFIIRSASSHAVPYYELLGFNVLQDEGSSKIMITTFDKFMQNCNDKESPTKKGGKKRKSIKRKSKR